MQKRSDRAGLAGQRRHALPGVCSLAIHQQRQLGREWRERGAPCGRTRTLGDEDLLFSELGFEGSKTVLAKNSPTFSGQLVVKSLYKVTFCKVKTPRTKISSPGLLIPAASLLAVACQCLSAHEWCVEFGRAGPTTREFSTTGPIHCLPRRLSRSRFPARTPTSGRARD